MVFGYIRVSKDEQNLDLQTDALKKHGCDRIFKEKISGAKKVRPEYDKLLLELRKGDSLVIWKIDRLGRTTLELIKLMVEFAEQGVSFISTTEGIDTGTEMGKIWYMLCSIFAQNERRNIIERTRAGLESARARGRVGGRPQGLSAKAKKNASAAASLYNSGKHTNAEIMSIINIKSKGTLYNYLRHEGIEIKSWAVK